LCVSDVLVRGRELFERRVWGAAFAALSIADSSMPLGCEDLERIGQPSSRVLAGRAVNAPLEVADRPWGEARRFGELLLRQPGFNSQLPQ
jgi:hypothetical protein